MPENQLHPIYLADYEPPPFLIESVDLTFDLDPIRTRVTVKSIITRNPKSSDTTHSLSLDGDGLVLDRVLIDGQFVPQSRVELKDDKLIIDQVHDRFELVISTDLNPTENDALEGLYMTNGRFCTQCEAEGFRRITYFIDRPDVLSRYCVELRAEREKYPVLLSNGNLIDKGSLDDGRHYCIWDDPFPKPCYLFALVAGELACVENTYTTASNRSVSLSIYVEPGKEPRATYAMDSLMRAMAWDEHVYGLEYDLDEFNIVAVSDFNMGAMENKSLNIFNDKFILAEPDTATDSDYAWIESVVAHEYFHNWTGNRVTCRDWFQLSLKEGLTVFRDQQFSADARSATVQRIEDVRSLRQAQFAEDDGPLAHPVRPHSYAEINNFYTHTVYEKGAEVVRMLHTLLGSETFHRGIDLYIDRHDGQAVTCEDFVNAMTDVSGQSLEQFLLWYSQAGTPIVKIHNTYDEGTGIYTLSLHQSCKATPDQEHKKPFHIPFSVGFIDRESGEIETNLIGEPDTKCITHILSLTEVETEYRFSGFPSHCTAPLVSLNRGFSAPVIVNIDRKPQDLGAIMATDTDPFARWDASQELVLRILMGEIKGRTDDDALSEYFRAMSLVISRAEFDPAAAAQILSLPSETVLSDQMKIIDPDAIFRARHWLTVKFLEKNKSAFEGLFERFNTRSEFKPNAEDAGKRALKNKALEYLVHDSNGQGVERAYDQYLIANNMTDRWAALSCLNDIKCKQRGEAFDSFQTRYANETLVIDKWFAFEAKSALELALQRVKELLTHPNYDRKNPNRIRALVGTFAEGNAVGFHQRSGEGYTFVADQILEIDQFNPQVAARLASAFQKWTRYGEDRKNLMRKELLRMSGEESLSQDVREIVTKTLIAN